MLSEHLDTTMPPADSAVPSINETSHLSPTTAPLPAHTPDASGSLDQVTAGAIRELSRGHNMTMEWKKKARSALLQKKMHLFKNELIH